MNTLKFSDLPKDIREHAEKVIGIELTALSPKTYSARGRLEANLKGIAVRCWNAAPAQFTSAFKAEVEKAANNFLRMNEDVCEDNSFIRATEKVATSNDARRKARAKEGSV